MPSVPAAHHKELADLILKLSKEDQQILRMRGENGKLYSELNYNFTKCIDKLEKMLMPNNKMRF